MNPSPLPAGAPVFLTGGTGLVGSHVATLLRSEGHPVRALHRANSVTGYLEGLECELVQGDLQDPVDELARGMVGCSGIVHCAAVIYSGGPWAQVHAVNVEGSDTVFRAAATAGIGRGVHLSSVAVYGGAFEGADEEFSLDRAPLHPREHYARSKREAEAVVSRRARESGMAVSILRPSVLYGERDRLFIPTVVRVLDWPCQILLGSGRTPIPAVYAGNLADAIVATLRSPLPEGARAFNLGGDHPLSQRHLYTELARVLGKRARLVPLPAALVVSFARIGEAFGLRVPGAEELSLRRAASLAVRPNPYRSTRLRAELGWTPPVSLATALERTGRWVLEVSDATA